MYLLVSKRAEKAKTEHLLPSYARNLGYFN